MYISYDGYGKETDMHILFQCDFARTVWYQSGIQLLNTIMPEDSVFEVLRRMFDNVSRDQCIRIRICLICWSLWNRRNKWVWDKANDSAFGVNAAAANLFHDWKEAHKVQVKPLSARNIMADKKWRKPPDDWYKINVDATGACNGYIGFGCVIRDSQALSLKEAIIWSCIWTDVSSKPILRVWLWLAITRMVALIFISL